MNKTPSPLFQEQRELDRRHIWATVRSWMEVDNYKQKRRGGRRRHHWDALEVLLNIFDFGLKLIGYHERGVKNARTIQLQQVDLLFPQLPKAFDGYSILHVTDPHFDCLPAFEDLIIEAISGVEADLCVFTGDYKLKVHGPYLHIVPAMQKVVSALTVRDGILATLGNHDTVFFVNHFEKMGVRVLANESVSLHREDTAIHITGIDDPHYYYTPMAEEALSAGGDGFKIALIHTPELYDLAAENGYSLYLTGHTHGGQITFPNQRPILTHLHAGRHLAKGLWHHSGMTGYTGNGTGTSGIPIRFNTRGEITRFTLRCGEPADGPQSS